MWLISVQCFEHHRLKWALQYNSFFAVSVIALFDSLQGYPAMRVKIIYGT